MKAESRHKGGNRATRQVGSHRSTTEDEFCRCGWPYVRTRSGPRVCVLYRHPEPGHQILVRARNGGRPWWGSA